MAASSSARGRIDALRFRQNNSPDVFVERGVMDSTRVRCPRCGVRIEQVPWAQADSGFTFAAEREVAYLAQRTHRTSVTGLMRIAWMTVGRIIRRVIRRHREQRGAQLDGLRMIGVDELVPHWRRR